MYLTDSPGISKYTAHPLALVPSIKKQVTTSWLPLPVTVADATSVVSAEGEIRMQHQKVHAVLKVQTCEHTHK